MGSVTEEMEGSDMKDLDLEDELDQFDDLDIGIEQEKGITDKVSDILLKDTSGKSLSSYDLEEYSFMPDSQGSKRILRALDCAIGHLDTVISDLIIGFFQISKDLGGE